MTREEGWNAIDKEKTVQCLQNKRERINTRRLSDKELAEEQVLGSHPEWVRV